MDLVTDSATPLVMDSVKDYCSANRLDLDSGLELESESDSEVRDLGHSSEQFQSVSQLRVPSLQELAALNVECSSVLASPALPGQQEPDLLLQDSLLQRQPQPELESDVACVGSPSLSRL